MGGALSRAAAIIAFMALIVAGIYVESAVWKECLSNHSLLYCLRTLG